VEVVFFCPGGGSLSGNPPSCTCSTNGFCPTTPTPIPTPIPTPVPTPQPTSQVSPTSAPPTAASSTSTTVTISIFNAPQCATSGAGCKCDCCSGIGCTPSFQGTVANSCTAEQCGIVYPNGCPAGNGIIRASSYVADVHTATGQTGACISIGSGWARGTCATADSSSSWTVSFYSDSGCSQPLGTYVSSGPDCFNDDGDSGKMICGPVSSSMMVLPPVLAFLLHLVM